MTFSLVFTRTGKKTQLPMGLKQRAQWYFFWRSNKSNNDNIIMEQLNIARIIFKRPFENNDPKLKT